MKKIQNLLFTPALLIALVLQLTNFLNAQERAVPARSYFTKKIEVTPPKIDGIIDEEAWSIVEWSGDFTQSIPYDGKKPSQDTKIKIIYDDENLYVAVRAFDTAPDSIISRLVRRDNVGAQRRHNCDDIEIMICSDGDNTSIVNFTLAVSGSKSDYYVSRYGFNWDVNYSLLWEGETSIDDKGWIAEVKIPFNQLHFPQTEEQKWGLLVRRTIFRTQEESIWQWIPVNSPGWAHLVGYLEGIKNVKSTKHIELLPHVVGKNKSAEKDPNNPYSKSSTFDGTIGLDAKIGISNSMTINLTANPDFGQVEADPAVLNLTNFETFFSEKREFFLEGKDIFDFSSENDLLFYSRRIGSAPFYTSKANKGYIDSIDYTRILGAMKLTGKTKNGVSIGILDALTRNEMANTVDVDGNNEEEVNIQPLANYFVGRVRKNYSNEKVFGSVGGILTSVIRDNSDDKLKKLTDNSLAGGIDFNHRWYEGGYFISGNFIFSNIQGNENAIARIQQTATHAFQVPNSYHVNLDSSRTSLSGHGGELSLGKRDVWWFTQTFGWKSPGLELNDLGYNLLADEMYQRSEVRYVKYENLWIFRDLFVDVTQENRWNFNGNWMKSMITVNGDGRFMNNWSFSLIGRRVFSYYDSRMMFGGPKMKVDGFYRTDYGLGSDVRKKFSYNLYGRYDWADDHVSKLWILAPEVNYKITNGLDLGARYSFTYDLLNVHYVDVANNGGQKEYIVSQLEQNISELTLRANYIITPELSVQYYVNPFVASAKYFDHGRVLNPTTSNINDRVYRFNDSELSEVEIEGEFKYRVTNPDNSTYDFINRNLNNRQFLSNLVIRWEYRLGSSIYFVWSQRRGNYLMNNQFTENINMGNVFDDSPINIFMIKLNYLFISK